MGRQVHRARDAAAVRVVGVGDRIDQRAVGLAEADLDESAGLVVGVLLADAVGQDLGGQA